MVLIEESIEILNLSNKKAISKINMRRIGIDEMPAILPDFKSQSATKDNILANWLMQWIKEGLRDNKLRPNDLLPLKADLANYLGVSIGTVQTAIRFIEDKKFVESKQRIGTFICDIEKLDTELRKQTSKRQYSIIALKKIFIKSDYKVGEKLPSARELAKIILSAPNTTRLALEFLASEGIIETCRYKGNKSIWILKEIPVLTNDEISGINNEIGLGADTLVDQVERDLKELILQKYRVNDKIPCHFQLAIILKVSIKTIHDAMKRISRQGIINPKRGRYGTTIMRMPSQDQFNDISSFSSIFAPAEDASFYHYEKVENYLKSLIKNNFKIGDRIPPMSELASKLEVSSNTVRKALQKLSNENIVRFSQGRYGGTFVIGIPDAESSFTWLSVNPEHSTVYKGG